MTNDSFLLALDAITRPHAHASVHDHTLYREINLYLLHAGAETIGTMGFREAMELLGYRPATDAIGRPIWIGVGLLATNPPAYPSGDSLTESLCPNAWMTERAEMIMEVANAYTV